MNLPDLHDNIVAIATAPGVAAIGMLRVSGLNAIGIVNQVFKNSNLDKAKGHSAHFGTISDGDYVLDEVVAIVYRNPKSYTGEDLVELTCHGSPYILQKITALLIRQGARMANPGEFTLRAFLNGKMDLSQAEAVADLINADSEKAHSVAMQQMRGGYSSEIKILRQRLIDFAALVELELDFSEEDVEFVHRDHMIETVEQLKKIILTLIKSFEFGNVIKNGVPTVIAGKPNAGKSTLLNALLKEDRAIVSEIPGTTRDTVEEVLNLDGLLFRLIDTAGLQETGDAIESIGVQKAMDKIGSASLLIYVFDLQNETRETVSQALSDLKGYKQVIVVGNKLDLMDQAKTELLFNANDFVLVSGKTGTGLDVLRQKMTGSVLSSAEHEDQTIVSNLRHAEALQKALDALQEVEENLKAQLPGELLSIELRSALDALGAITGEITNDDLLGSIFSNFCIGK